MMSPRLHLLPGSDTGLGEVAVGRLEAEAVPHVHGQSELPLVPDLRDLPAAVTWTGVP